MWLLIISLVLAGIEPFIPVGSFVAGWAGVVGVKRRDWWGLAAVVVAGLGRDVALVGRLGLSSAVLVLVWSVSGLAVNRFSRPASIAAASAALGASFFSLINRALHLTEVAVSAVFAVLILKLWTGFVRRSGGIKVG